MGLHSFDELVSLIKACRLCRARCNHEPNPVVRLFPNAKILIIGQAPGTRVHATNLPWNDPSGDLLREWLQVDRPFFYDSGEIAVMPMGFCYPGKGKSGDLPPSPICAPTWHQVIRSHLPHLQLTLLVGSYAQAYYLKETRKETLAETVAAWGEYVPQGYFPLVHPSPRNRFWRRTHPWFEEKIIPELRLLTQKIWSKENA